ncbi:PIN domain-containing protein [Zhihengliuella flava]|uniref:Nucleic acid-binding protein n=1 Tax=Zhihengliuella flava TaxID=1285193 RepID=A0A931GEI1_9MICC|nr:PIN domain-containing protein [Zhihengliuella flava]MBG6084438.1 putative nucleic acid-binding protein [Zhihengliuella flava]
MRWYLDSSVALDVVLRPLGRSASWMKSNLTRGDEFASSSLLKLEAARVLRRENLALQSADHVLRNASFFGIDDGVLRFAAAIEPHVKSLDAIHLATCSLLGSTVTMASHDRQMLAVAEELGLDVHDPRTPS